MWHSTIRFFVKIVYYIFYYHYSNYHYYHYYYYYYYYYYYFIISTFNIFLYLPVSFEDVPLPVTVYDTAVVAPIENKDILSVKLCEVFKIQNYSTYI